ncbi:MAG TPA: ATP-binding cassette domain-containing protein [Mucilaginibacter sp.]
MIHSLKVESVELSFGEKKVLSDIFIKCSTHEIIGLLGRNGQGKTCLIKVILGNLRANNSFISFDETKVVNSLKYPNLIRYLPQFNFIPANLKLKTVFEDFGMDYEDFTMKFPEFEMNQTSRVGYLSGGQRRILEIYIISKSATRFALLDEPFTHLNPLQIEKIKDFLIEEKSNKGIIITDHMYQHILDISNITYLLKDGKTHLIKTELDLDRLGYINLAWYHL